MGCYRIPKICYKEKFDIKYLIEKAADFLGTEKSLQSLACIDIALDYAIELRKEVETMRAIMDSEGREEDKR
jgi:hypothetical protein